MSTTDKIKLKLLGLPIVQDLNDLAEICLVSKHTLYQLSMNADRNYNVFDIPKKTKGFRTICQPSRRLKGLQSWILTNILNKTHDSSSSKGFKKGSSTVENALPHMGCSTLLNIDLENFFPSISSKRVFNVFKVLGYNNTISTIFTRICTHDGRLPQGSPCSPKLANLVAWGLDVRIQGYVGIRGITYTRYADDLSFSGLSPLKVIQVIPMVNEIILSENFTINKNKTRVAGVSKAKITTGLVINDDKVGVGRKRTRLLRAKLHRLCQPENNENLALLNHIRGWLYYLNSVDKHNLNKLIRYIETLKSKYPDSLILKIKVTSVRGK